MKERNVEMLKARLIQLGFEPSVEIMLRCHLCFAPGSFDVIQKLKVGVDRFVFSVRIELAAADEYEIRYYMVTLCKQVLIPAELQSLDEEMRGVDWMQLVAGRSSVVAIDPSKLLSSAEIIQKIQSMGSAADVLRYKYWSGSPLEAMISNLASLRSSWELSEKFYLFDETLPITFPEAVRFLNSRWMEKQVSIKRRLLVKNAAGEEGNNGGSFAGGKLLTKNSRKIVRRKIDK